MTIPSWVNNGTAASGTGTSIAPALPASRTTNNILLAFVLVKATGKTISVSGTGWTLGDSASSGNLSAAWAWRLVDGAEAAPTFSWTGSAGYRAYETQWTGNATSSPIGNIANVSGNSGTTLTSQSIVSSADNSLAIIQSAVDNNVTITNPPGWTAQTSSGGTSAGIFYPIDQVVYVSGSTTQNPNRITSSSINWVNFTIELKGSGSAPAGEPITKVTGAFTQVLLSYTNPTNMLVTGVFLQVLRTEAVTSEKTSVRIIG